jgi:tetratricopeptide (TPR) repeat protein
MNDCLSLRERVFVPGIDAAQDGEWLAHVQICPQCREAHDTLPLADLALAEVARLPMVVPSFDSLATVAASTARAQRRRVKARRFAPFLYTTLGTAALAAAVVFAFFVKGQRPVPRLDPGTEIQASSEAKSAVLASGARIRLEAGTLKLASASKEKQSLVMRSGRVFLEVPKLPAGSTLSVVTPDAEVKVRGTRFQVNRTAQETQVLVQEGVVEVVPEGPGRASQTVKAGETVTVPSAASYRENLRRSTVEALDHGQFDAAEEHIGHLLRTDPEAAQRAEVQALLAWSLAARGQRDQAVERYRQALKLLPEGQSPLWAENACAELAILVQQKTPKSGPAVWAECLRRFPNGVHTNLARVRANSSR